MDRFRLAEIARTAEYGSEAQINAENSYIEMVRQLLTADQIERHDDYGLKATTDEMINFAESLIVNKVDGFGDLLELAEAFGYNEDYDVAEPDMDQASGWTTRQAQALSDGIEGFLEDKGIQWVELDDISDQESEA